MKKWIKKKELYIIHSYNFVDFSDQDEPFKTSVTMSSLGVIENSKRVDAIIPLRLNDVELADNIFDPLGLDVDSF